MPIKIPEVGRLNDPGSTAARQSLGVGQQASAALQGFAKSAQDISNKLANVSIAIAEADNAKKISEAELKVNEISSQYLQSLEGDTNEDMWVPGAKEAFDDIRRVVGTQGLSPEASRKLEGRMNRLESNFLLRVGNLAASQIASRAKEAGLLAAEVAASNQDPQGYANAIGDMVEAGVITPETGGRMRMEGGKKIRSAQLQELVLANPQEAKAQVEDGDWDDLPPSARSQALYRAEVESNKEKREFYNDLSFAMESGEVPSEDQINAWKEQGMMTAGQAADFIKRANAKRPVPFDSVKYMEMNRAMSEYDANQDDDAKSGLTALISKVKGSGFTGTEMTRLNTKLEKIIAGTGTAPARVRNQMLDVLKFYAERGEFGLDMDDEGKIIPETQKKSSDQEAQLLDEFDLWLAKNPDASHTEARKAADDIIKPIIDKSGADDILDVNVSDIPSLKDVFPNDDLPQFDDTTENQIDPILFN